MEAIQFQATLDGGAVIHVPPNVTLPTGTADITVRPVVEIDEEKVQRDIAGTRAMLLRWADEMEKLDIDLPADFAENHDHYIHGKPLS